jgi:two-component system, cell cycle sensor histidine kinase and response regulator CckA
MTEQQVAKASAVAESDPMRGNETVLVVEDIPVVRGLVRCMLEQAGYTVLEACDGDEALALAGAGSRIDLLLTDVVMPGMSGRVLAERLQARQPQLRVLFTSGYSADALGKHGVLDRNSAFLEKPYATRTLRLRVRSALDDER